MVQWAHPSQGIPKLAGWLIFHAKNHENRMDEMGYPHDLGKLYILMVIKSDSATRKPYWLVVSNMAFIFHFIYGMSSFPLTNSYFSRLFFNHQPAISLSHL